MTDVAKARESLQRAVESFARRTPVSHRVSVALDALIAAARAEERERCARVCDAAAEASGTDAAWHAGRTLAARIRALSGKP